MSLDILHPSSSDKAGRGTSRWEQRCRQCGQCCFDREQREDGSVAVNLHRPCKYLDLETRRCMVYRHRRLVNAGCQKLRLWHALWYRLMPHDCGYVLHYRRRWGSLEAGRSKE